MANTRYLQYLSQLEKPFTKRARLEFLNPDGSVAFSLDNNFKRGYRTKYDTRAFLQDGSLNVSLQNGMRRSASVTLSNLDDAFSYSVDRLWLGTSVRLSMGLVLPDGTDFYIPQGVFYLSDPKAEWSPDRKTVSYDLVDKWAYLDGTLFGTLDNTYIVPAKSGDVPTNIFDAMQSVLRLSKFTRETEYVPSRQIDPVQPIFTSYYNGKTYDLYTGGKASMTDVPYDVRVDAIGGTFADILLELNTFIAGWIGYDRTGALRVEASQNDISDASKPILWSFSESTPSFLGLSESQKPSSVYNDVIIIGEGLTGYEVYGRASNYDPASDTNINIIGRKTFREAQSSYWNAQQCIDLAQFYLKRKTVLQKSVSIRSSQLFHLEENQLVSVHRTDKQGSPIEKHLIQSYTLPIGETGEMTIDCVSVNDFPVVATKSSLTTEVTA